MCGAQKKNPGIISKRRWLNQDINRKTSTDESTNCGLRMTLDHHPNIEMKKPKHCRDFSERRSGEGSQETYPLVNWNSYWKWPFIVFFFHKKWWFSIVTLVYQRVFKDFTNKHRDRIDKNKMEDEHEEKTGKLNCWSPNMTISQSSFPGASFLTANIPVEFLHDVAPNHSIRAKHRLEIVFH